MVTDQSIHYWLIFGRAILCSESATALAPALLQTHYYPSFAWRANMAAALTLNSSLSSSRHRDTSLVSRLAALLPCRPKRDRAAVHCRSAYNPLMPSEKGMISTDKPDQRHASPGHEPYKSLLQGLCFFCIFEKSGKFSEKTKPLTWLSVSS